MDMQAIQTARSSSSSLEFLLNDQIPAEHHELIAATLNQWWGWLVETNANIIERRIKSGIPFISAYAPRRMDDFVEGSNLIVYGLEIPVVNLEMVFLKTGGDKDKVPRSYKSLTNSGLWLPIPRDYDTVIFVDLTGIPSRIGKNGNGEVEQTVQFGKAYLLGQTDHVLPFDPRKIKHIWTYSPNIDGIVKMHIKYGASDTNHVIGGARDPFKNNLRGLSEDQFRELYPKHNVGLHNTRLMSYLG